MGTPDECLYSDGDHGPAWADGDFCWSCRAAMDALAQSATDDAAADKARQNDVIAIVAVIIEVRRTSTSARTLILRPQGGLK